MSSLRSVVTAGCAIITQHLTMVDRAFEAAQETGSSTRIVDVCKGSLQLHQESLKFLMELGSGQIAAALDRDITVHEADIKQQRNEVMEKAEGLIDMGYHSCTSTQQVSLKFVFISASGHTFLVLACGDAAAGRSHPENETDHERSFV